MEKQIEQREKEIEKGKNNTTFTACIIPIIYRIKICLHSYYEYIICIL